MRFNLQPNGDLLMNDNGIEFIRDIIDVVKIELYSLIVNIKNTDIITVEFLDTMIQKFCPTIRNEQYNFDIKELYNNNEIITLIIFNINLNDEQTYTYSFKRRNGVISEIKMPALNNPYEETTEITRIIDLKSSSDILEIDDNVTDHIEPFLVLYNTANNIEILNGSKRRLEIIKNAPFESKMIINDFVSSNKFCDPKSIIIRDIYGNIINDNYSIQGNTIILQNPDFFNGLQTISIEFTEYSAIRGSIKIENDILPVTEGYIYDIYSNRSVIKLDRPLDAGNYVVKYYARKTKHFMEEI